MRVLTKAPTKESPGHCQTPGATTNEPVGAVPGSASHPFRPCACNRAGGGQEEDGAGTGKEEEGERDGRLWANRQLGCFVSYRAINMDGTHPKTDNWEGKSDSTLEHAVPKPGIVAGRHRNRPISDTADRAGGKQRYENKERKRKLTIPVE